MLRSTLVALQWYRNRWPSMTLNGRFALNFFRAWQLLGWRLRLSDKTVRKFAELPINSHGQKCSPENIASGSIMSMHIFAGVSWYGASNESGVRWKWRFSLHSFTVFRIFYIHGHTTAFRWYDCQWPWAYFKVIVECHFTLPSPISRKLYRIRPQKLKFLIGNQTSTNVDALGDISRSLNCFTSNVS